MRRDEYQRLKNEIGARMVEQVCTLFPQIGGKIDSTIVGEFPCVLWRSFHNISGRGWRSRSAHALFPQLGGKIDSTIVGEFPVYCGGCSVIYQVEDGGAGLQALPSDGRKD